MWSLGCVFDHFLSIFSSVLHHLLSCTLLPFILSLHPLSVTPSYTFFQSRSRLPQNTNHDANSLTRRLDPNRIESKARLRRPIFPPVHGHREERMSEGGVYGRRREVSTIHHLFPFLPIIPRGPPLPLPSLIFSMADCLPMRSRSLRSFNFFSSAQPLTRLSQRSDLDPRPSPHPTHPTSFHPRLCLRISPQVPILRRLGLFGGTAPTFLHRQVLLFGIMCIDGWMDGRGHVGKVVVRVGAK